VPLPLKLQKSLQPGLAISSGAVPPAEYFTVKYSTNLANGFIGWQSNVLATPASECRYGAHNEYGLLLSVRF